MKRNLFYILFFEKIVERFIFGLIADNRDRYCFNLRFVSEIKRPSDSFTLKVVDQVQKKLLAYIGF